MLHLEISDSVRFVVRPEIVNFYQVPRGHTLKITSVAVHSVSETQLHYLLVHNQTFVHNFLSTKWG